MTTEGAAIEEILELVARDAGRDLRDYARSSLSVRVGARVEALGLKSPLDYCGLLKRDPDEVQRLAKSLLVHATGFFRDAAVFRALEEAVVPTLHAGLAPGLPLRAWSIGCATGEEAWSLAVVLAEVVGTSGGIEVLATDRDAPSLEVARAARYAVSRLETLPSRLRARWFDTFEGEVARPRSALREGVLFAIHDLVGPRLAPPEAIVSAFSLVACRNVLLYLDPRLRSKALERLATVLEHGGALVLGPAEEAPAELGLTAWPGLDPVLRIYRKTVTA